MQSEKPFLRPIEIAEYLDVTPGWVRLAIRNGVIPAVRLGRMLRVRREEFEKWLQERQAK